jgi:hypothetical protein
LAAEYTDLARQVEDELRQYAAISKPPYLQELPLGVVSTHLQQPKTQGGSPTDAPLGTADEPDTPWPPEA